MFVDIVFDGPPGPQPGRFVEVENAQGRSINLGEWVHRPDGYWALRINGDALKLELGNVPLEPSGWEFFCEGCDTFRDARRADEHSTRDDGLYHEFVCNTCHSILLTFQSPSPEVKPAPDVASAMCPYCGSVNLFPGLTSILAYVCHECGESVTRIEG
jgi:hypothetical protein